MFVSEDGYVTGSIDVSKLDEIEAKTDEAKAQIAALKAEAQAGQQVTEEAEAKVAAQHEAQAAQLSAEPAEAAAEPVAQPDEGADLDQLRAEAESLGVKVDKRWGADRLRAEIDAARQE